MASIKSCTEKELESLIGTLDHACAVVHFSDRPLPCYASLAKIPHHRIKLIANFISNIA